MKQINKTPEINALLTQSVGASVNIENLAVYEAIALNNRPIRKNHPLYKGAIADRSLLLEMAAALSIESRPVQIQHKASDDLPSGRAFHGAVVDKGGETELRVLFFVDKSEDKLLAKLDSGTVDQVSVSVIPKQLLNSKSGFDYLGAEATPENIWTGNDGKGNILGQNGVHARLVGLGQWAEISLVGMGGAENARIVSHDESYFGSSYQKLAASGVDPSVFLLEASTENKTMDLTALTDKLTTLSADLATSTANLTALNAKLETSNARITELEAALETANKPDETLTAELATATGKVTTLEAENTAAVDALKEIAKTVLTASGKLDAEVPGTVAELTALIDESKATLAATLAAGGKSKDSVGDVEDDKVVANFSAFRRASPGRR